MLIGTSTAPARAAPSQASRYSGRLGRKIPTEPPGVAPADIRPRATSVTAASSAP
ncbi:predicted protein [Streptomyces iranensis]|uniref:Uncharacterized protein n=1 Tax=Streptomyces iranensis TaxID=576784 RepID=A0A061ABD9_9ACTN|nr:predicted protein [Streptomyces iranensis]